MKDIIVIGILALILGLAVFYIYKSKKAGKKCIGCPDSGTCCSCSSCSGGKDCACGK